MQWYYAVNGQQQGPVEWETLVSLAREGKVKPSDLVWNSTMGSEWTKASTVSGLFDAAASMSSPGAGWSSRTTFKGSTHNRDLMGSGRLALDGQWGLAVGANVVYLLIAIALGIIPMLGPLINFVISGPLALGWYLFFLVLSRRQPAGIGMIFDGFKQFGTAFLATLLMGLLILAWLLPSLVVVIVAGIVMGIVGLKHIFTGGAPEVGKLLLLIPLFVAAFIPAMIAQLRYSMTYFVINDIPGIGPLEAIRQSTRMMSGNKWKLFCLQWRFFGWTLLCILTFGIGLLWLLPYMMTSMACFYDDLKKEPSQV